MRNRIIVFLLIFIFFLLGVAKYLSLENGGSTYSYRKSGNKAFFEFLSRTNNRVNRLLKPVSDLDKEKANQLLISITPKSFPVDEPFIEWVKSGNGLIFFGPKHGTLENAFFDDLKEDKKKSKKKSSNSKSIFDSMREGLRNLDYSNIDQEKTQKVDCPTFMIDSCFRVKTISAMNPLSSSILIKGEAYSASQGDASIVHRKVGLGDIWIFSENKLINNDNIDKADNLRLLYQIASKYDEIIFDEFHHGYVAPATKEVAVKKSNLFILSGCFLGLLAFVALSRSFRFGPPAWIYESEKVAPSLEYTSVLGMLYSEHNSVEILEFYVESWKKRVASLLKISPRLSNRDFIVKLASKGSLAEFDSDVLLDSMDKINQSKNSSQVKSYISNLEAVFEKLKEMEGGTR